MLLSSVPIPTRISITIAARITRGCTREWWSAITSSAALAG